MVIEGLPPKVKPFTAVILKKDKEITFQQFKVALRNFEDTDKATAECGATSVLHLKSKSTYDNSRKLEGTCFLCKRKGHKA